MAGTQTIEVDEATAQKLETRARKLGVSVSELVAEMTALQPVEVPDDVLSELDRSMAAVKAGEPTIANADVERWLKTWGTPDFKPWRER